jgi:geranylgeranylglycerol-phosphate geranylgeranyltransferase
LFASPAPYLLGTFSLVYLAAVLPADAVMLAAAYWSFDDPTRGQTWLKYGQLWAALAFVVGRVAA